jgi:ankyrin repeat protein
MRRSSTQVPRSSARTIQDRHGYAAAEGQVDAVQLLLDRGVDVNQRYNHNLTALMWAAGYGKSDCLKLLLERGADPKLKDDRGKTAADIAAEQGYQAVAAMLRDSAG